MENYSQTSQDILQKLIDQLEQGVAQVAEAENTTRDKVMKCAKLTIRDQIFKMERAKNTFNLFCEEFKTEYNDKKEEFQNKYPKKNYIQIAKLQFDQVSAEEKHAIIQRASAKEAKQQDPQNAVYGIRKANTIRRYIYNTHDVSSLMIDFRPNAQGELTMSSSAFGEQAKKVLDFVKKSRVGGTLENHNEPNGIIEKTTPKAVKWNKVKARLGRRLLKLFNEQLDAISTRLYYEKMKDVEYPVQCLGWPEEASFTCHSDLSSAEFPHVVRALDKGQIRFVFKSSLTAEQLSQTVAGKIAAAAPNIPDIADFADTDDMGSLFDSDDEFWMM